MKFFKAVINNATEFTLNNKEAVHSLDSLNTIRTNYCQLLWMKSIVDDMRSEVNNALKIYNEKIEPIVKNVSNALEEIDHNTLYDMWDLNYYNNEGSRIPRY
jgi:phage gp29-like protein